MSPYKAPLILLACVVGLGVAACGSSGSNSSSPSSPAASSAAPSKSDVPVASQAIYAKIASDWAAFFSAKTPVSQRVSLLQDGQQFASIIQAQAGQGLAAEASARVDGVQLLTINTAKVVYDVLLNGTPALKAQSGTAVLQSGTWKVGASSFCGLLTLEGTKNLPKACSTAG
jgi:hypothetical protein